MLSGTASFVAALPQWFQGFESNHGFGGGRDPGPTCPQQGCPTSQIREQGRAGMANKQCFFERCDVANAGQDGHPGSGFSCVDVDYQVPQYSYCCEDARLSSPHTGLPQCGPVTGAPVTPGEFIPQNGGGQPGSNWPNNGGGRRPGSNRPNNGGGGRPSSNVGDGLIGRLINRIIRSAPLGPVRCPAFDEGCPTEMIREDGSAGESNKHCFFERCSSATAGVDGFSGSGFSCVEAHYPIPQYKYCCAEPARATESLPACSPEPPNEEATTEEILNEPPNEETTTEEIPNNVSSNGENPVELL